MGINDEYDNIMKTIELAVGIKDLCENLNYIWEYMTEEFIIDFDYDRIPAFSEKIPKHDTKIYSYSDTEIIAYDSGKKEYYTENICKKCEWIESECICEENNNENIEKS